MIVKIIIITILSIFSGLLYRLGGWEKGNKLWRRLLCPLLALGLFLGLKGVNWGYWWAYGLFITCNYAMLSTYHDWIGYDCWPLTGAGYGLAALPLLWCGVTWYAVIGRTILLALTIWWLRSRTGRVKIEEIGSGLLYCGSIPILLI